MKALLLARKDLRIYFRDPVGLLLGLGLPVALATVFGFAMGAVGGGDDATPRVRLYVEDLDRSEASCALVDALTETPTLRVRRVEADEEESAREHVAEGDGPAGLLIRPGFGAGRSEEGEPALVLLRDPAKEIELQLVTASLIPTLFEVRGEALARDALRRSLDFFQFPGDRRAQATLLLDETWENMAALDPGWGQADGETSSSGFRFASAVPALLGLGTEDVVGGEEEGAMQRGAQAHSVSGIAVMMLLFGLVACGGTLLEEEAQGTLDRLRLAMGRGGAVLGGKFLFTWIIGVVQLAILFFYGSWLFDVPIFRSPLALAVLSASLACAATGFGILFAVLCKSRAQLEGLSTVVILTMSALGGAWWPLTMAPDWYQFLGHFTLTAWAMDGFQGIFWYGQGLTEILPEIGVLLAIGLVTSGGALVLWSRRQRVS